MTPYLTLECFVSNLMAVLLSTTPEINGYKVRHDYYRLSPKVNYPHVSETIEAATLTLTHTHIHTHTHLHAY